MDIPIVINFKDIGNDPASLIAAVVGQMREMASAAVALAEEGDAVSDRMAALKISLEGAQEATGGEVDKMTLLTLALQAQNTVSGLTSEKFAEITAFAKNAADKGLGSFETAVNDITRAMATGRTKSLVGYGLDMERITAATDKAAEITRQMHEKVSGLSGGMDTAGDAIARLKTDWADWNTDLAQSFTESEKLSKEIENLRESLGRTGVSANETGFLLAEMATDGVKGVNKLIAALERARGVISVINPLWGRLMDYAQYGSSARGQAMPADVQAEIDRGRAREANLSSMEEALFPEGGAEFAPTMASVATERAARREARAEGRGGRGGRNQERLSMAERSFDEALGDLSRPAPGTMNADYYDEQENLRQLDLRRRREYEEERRRIAEEAGQVELDGWIESAANEVEYTQKRIDLSKERNAIEEANIERRLRLAEEAAAREAQLRNREYADHVRGVSRLGGLLETTVDIFGGKEADKNYLKGGTLMVEGMASLYYQDYIGAAEAFAAGAFAFVTAAKQDSGGRAKHKGLAGSSAGGGGSPAGAGFSGIGGGAGGTGEGTKEYNFYLGDHVYLTEDQVGDAFHAALVRAGDNGRKIPARIIDQ